MKTNLEQVSSLSRKLNVQVPQNVVQTTFDKVFKGIQKSVEIKGFRKGKAPITTIKSLYGDRVMQDVAQELIQSHYPQALSEHKLNPISYPEFEFEDPTELKDFSFSAVFDIRPEVTLKKYEGLSVEKEKFELEPKKVEDIINNIRKSRSTLDDVALPRPVKKGEIAVIDFEGFIDGNPLPNGSGTDHHLELGTNSFIEGFEEGVEGMTPGESRTLSLKFPEVYHAADIAGKPVQFKVTLKSIKQRVMPELTDELLKSMGAPGTVEEFKKTIAADIEQSEKKRIEDAFKNRLLKVLVDANPVDVPQSLMKEQKASLIADFEKRMQQEGMSEHDFNAYVEKWDADFAKTASEMIQASFLIDEIARKHDLLCKKEDIDARFDEYAKSTGIELEKIREFYKTPEQMSRLTYMITEDKVIKFLTQSASVKEVSKKDLKESEQ